MNIASANILRGVAILLGLSTIACSGDWCKDLTATVVGETVSGSKQVVKGIAEGVEEGRKTGESADGAVIVTQLEDLKDVGKVSIYAIHPMGESATIEIVVENLSDTPLRLSNMKFMVLDDEGFTKPPNNVSNGITVPAKAKDKISLQVQTSGPKVKEIRLWGKALEIPEDALKDTDIKKQPDAGNPK